MTSTLRTRSVGEVSVALAAAALTIAAVVITARADPADELARAIRQALIICIPVAGGIYASRTPQTRRFGIALIAAGFVWSLTALGYTDTNPEYSIGRLVAWLIFPFLLYLILVYPEGCLRAGFERGLFGATVVLVTVSFIGSALFVEAYPLGTPWAVCTTDCPPNTFLILHAEPAFMDVVRPLRELLAGILMIAIVVVLIRRLRGANRQRRRQMAPVIVAGICSCATLTAYLAVRHWAPDSGAVDTLGMIWSLSIPGIAAAFFAGLIARRMLVGQTLERLTVAISREPGPRQLQTELAVILDDPEIEILLPDGIPGGWQSLDGESVFGPTAADTDRERTTITDGTTPLALLVHDSALRDDEELLHAVQALILSWLRHVQIRQRLAGSLRQLEDSRSRLVRAADQERSRIERDLHDGAQQHLIMLRIKLSLAEELLETDPAAGRRAVGELGSEIERALDEVRAIAHGVYPSVLSDRGLEDALRGSMAGSVLPVHLITHRVSRQPAEIELAIYYVCIEALQNVQKHAYGASAVWVTVRQDDRLTLEVRDDGAGFVPASAPGGLRNMLDRIEAIGGRLVVDSAPGHGTRVLATVPLSNPTSRSARNGDGPDGLA
jgi:signal transduction histidine kinase